MTKKSKQKTGKKKTDDTVELKPKTTRRKFLAGTALAAASTVASWPLILIPGKAKAKNDTIVWATDGGRQAEKLRRVFALSFERETGVKVINVTGQRTASKVKSMVLSKNIEWDVLERGGAQGMVMQNEDLLEPIDTSIVDRSGALFPQWNYSHLQPYYFAPSGIAFDPQRNPNPPRNWKQFWDVEGFPGRRGLWAVAEETLEHALMADGVPANELYPLDVDRAFASLERIKKDIAIWVASHAKSLTLIQSGELDYDVTFAARVGIAKSEGISIDMSDEGKISQPVFLAVPKGTKKKDLVMQFIAHTQRPEYQALNAMSAPGGSGPVVEGAFELLTQTIRDGLPDPKDPNTVTFDVDWWATNSVEVNKRYKEFLISTGKAPG
jgi:putative spermidine/putrescine transport system substrate-binding protein